MEWTWTGHVRWMLVVMRIILFRLSVANTEFLDDMELENYRRLYVG